MAALAVSTLQPIPLRPVATNLPQLLLGAMQPLQHQAGYVDVSLRLEGPESLPLVMIDPEKIAWAVTTLVGNSMRFVKRGNRHMPGGSIIVRLAREDDDVLITVDDDGPGIPDAKLPWLFKRAPGTVHAAGLALMLVHDVAVAHGGSVEVKSNTDGEQRGTRITIRLPHAMCLSHAGAAEP